MKLIFVILILLSFETAGRNTGQTEITTEEGIEVFKTEKYYLLKKNVEIISDEFELKADLVKAHFNKDLYDITEIFAEGNASLNSSKGIKASGERIDFNIINEDLKIFGKDSLLINNEMSMKSDGSVKINKRSGFSVANVTLIKSGLPKPSMGFIIKSSFTTTVL